MASTEAELFIFVGHPRETSLSQALADAYEAGARGAGARVRRMDLNAMVFDPDLTHGYKARKTLEPDLEAWREAVTQARHIAIFYPQWWGGMPAKMKGVFDRAYLPGFAMRYHDKGPFWDRLLTGRSAEVFLTADTPSWWDRFVYGRPAARQIRKLVLIYAGIKPVSIHQLGPVKLASKRKIVGWIKSAEARGAAAGRRLSEGAALSQ
jgi:putative NADPH-quinone reductase